MPHFDEETDHYDLMIGFGRRIRLQEQAEWAKEEEERNWEPLLRLLREAMDRTEQWIDVDTELRRDFFLLASDLLQKIGRSVQSQGALTRAAELTIQLRHEDEAAEALRQARAAEEVARQ